MSTVMFTYDLFRKKYERIALTTNVDKVFPDRLLNLNQYKYKVIGASQLPRLFLKNGKFYGFDVFFLEIVAKKLNASFAIDIVNYADSSALANVQNRMGKGQIDLNLNTMNSGGNVETFSKYYKTFNTYDVDGYCALVPIPPRLSFLKYLLVPYDTASWILMLVSLVALAVIWTVFKTQRDSRSLSSVGHMILRVVAGFLGQAFNFVSTRWFHLLVMQIFIFMVLILGNAYQSLLVSLMTVSRNGTRITTVDEMMKGDFNYISESIFHVDILQQQPNSSMTERFQEDKTIYLTQTFNYKEKAANNSVLIVRCDFAHDIFFTENYKFDNGKTSDYYYILPEKLFTLYETLATGRFSPFVDKFAEYSLRIFESGIRQHWKTLLHKLTDEIDLNQISIIKEDYLLKMGDLKYVFYIWGIGLSLATIAFIIELLCYKYRARIRKSWVMRMIRRLSWSSRIRKREMMMIRRRARVVIEPFEEFEMIQC
jgi:hypothetical protein